MPFKSEKQRRWMYANNPEMAKRWEKEMKKGGITINVEGGEYIIKKDSVNDKTLPMLKEINETGSYGCGGHVYPTFDARKRSKGGK